MSFARPSCDARYPKNIPVVLMRTPPTRESVMPRLKVMMAQVDDGLERILQGVERRLPGEEF